MLIRWWSPRQPESNGRGSQIFGEQIVVNLIFECKTLEVFKILLSRRWPGMASDLLEERWQKISNGFEQFVSPCWLIKISLRNSIRSTLLQANTPLCIIHFVYSILSFSPYILFHYSPLYSILQNFYKTLERNCISTNLGRSLG